MRASLWRICAVCAAVGLTLLAGQVAYADDDRGIDRALCDLKVAYFFAEPSEIDWAAVAFLVTERRCRVALVRVQESDSLRVTRRALDNDDISVIDIAGPPARAEAALNSVFNVGKPDIVIFPQNIPDTLGRAILTQANAAVRHGTGAVDLFSVRKVYRRVDSSSVTQGVIMNRREILSSHAGLIAEAIEALFADAGIRPETLSNSELYSAYQLTGYNIRDAFRESEFTSGLNSLRLRVLITAWAPGEASRKSHLSLAESFERDFDAAREKTRRARLDLLASGYRALVTLSALVSGGGFADSAPHYRSYLRALLERARFVTLSEMGLVWSGVIDIRDTPFGPRVKLTADITVAGSLGVELAQVVYIADTGDVIIDSLARPVRPHQRLVREYYIDPAILNVASTALDSLRFALVIRYGEMSLRAPATTGLGAGRKLAVRFLPDFRFITRVSDVFADRNIEPFYWKVAVDKPKYFSGDIAVELKTPPGVAAGSAERTITLQSGMESETVQFPFVASSSMADGISRIVLTLKRGQEIIGVDTARIRVAECAIENAIKVGYLPDSTGVLEDILRMTPADFTALTDRALEVADLNAYHTLILGSGCHRQFRSLTRVNERLARFVRQGGVLAILGQPDDWPADAAPIRISPRSARLRGDAITVTDRGHRLFSTPYEVYTGRLTDLVDTRALSSPSAVAVGKSLLSDDAGRALLSIVNMGEGQIIYCGFPLLAQIAALDINAIHLFANLVSY